MVGQVVNRQSIKHKTVCNSSENENPLSSTILLHPCDFSTFILNLLNLAKKGKKKILKNTRGWNKFVNEIK